MLHFYHDSSYSISSTVFCMLFHMTVKFKFLEFNNWKALHEKNTAFKKMNRLCSIGIKSKDSKFLDH